jgi:hypothetical protein
VREPDKARRASTLCDRGQAARVFCNPRKLALGGELGGRGRIAGGGETGRERPPFAMKRTIRYLSVI